VLINRDFARLWFGQAVSTVGDFVFDMTLVVWIATVLFRGDPKAGPLAVGGLVACTVVATTVVGPVAGVFVDRWSRRRIMLRSEAIRFAMVGAVTLVTFLRVGALPHWAWVTILYGAVFGVAVAEQFFNPARFATIGDIVHGEVDRTRAFGIGSATSATAAIVGPSLASPLLITAGIQWAMLLNALSYLVSYLAIRSVRFPDAAPAASTSDPGATKPSWWADFNSGRRMFLGNRFLVALAVVGVFAQFGTGPINTLDVYFIPENLHADPKLIGVMATTMGCGAIVGSLISGRVVRAINARNTTWLGLVLTGVLLLVESRQTAFLAAVVVIFFVFVPLTMLNTALSPQLLAVTPREYLGRMNAFLAPVIQLSSMASIVVSSLMASTVLLHFHGHVAGIGFHRIDALYGAGALIIAASGAYAYFRLPPSTVAATPDPDTPDPERPESVAVPSQAAGGSGAGESTAPTEAAAGETV
jgi:MFS family permease